jgi:hypothetical protein
MPQADEVLRRLREDDEQLVSFADLLIDHALDRPLRSSIDREFLAAAICKGLTTLAEEETLEAWLAQRATRSLEGSEKITGVIGDRIPVTALAPLQAFLSRELTPDPALVHALMDHPSLHQLMRELLQANVLEFARRAKDIVAGGTPKAARGIGGMLGAVAKNVASVASSAVEKQLEDRARLFVEDAIAKAVETTINRFCDPAHAEDMATWRVDVLHALLQQPIETLIAERHKYPPEAFAEDTAAMIKALASWSELRSRVDGGLEFFLDLHGDQTARDWLDGSGLESALRDEVRAELVRQGRTLVQTPAFEGWLSALMA